MKINWPPHNMIVIFKVMLDLYTLSYAKYSGNDIHQCIKYNLSADDVAQFLGNN
jgi:hypothetical protein